MSFRGLHSINLDAKGRMAVPARFRTIIEAHNCQGKLVITIEQEAKSLVIYPLNEFIEIERMVEALPSSNNAAKRLKRLIIGHATDVDVDGSGRILIPPGLRELACLEKKVVLVGQGKKIELWDEAAWGIKRDEMLQETFTEEEMSEAVRAISL